MGYYSDIRFLVPTADYTKIKNDCQVKYGGESHFNYLDREEIRKDGDGAEFMYFGWNCIKWHTGSNNSDYNELDEIENAVHELEQYHKVRIGDNYDDIEEDFHLCDTDVDYINVFREFEEPRKTVKSDFKNFLENNTERQYTEKTKDYRFHFFKIPYDADCDFIYILRTYIYQHNPTGKPELNNKSELGGIYVYSLGLLFNVEYNLRDYLTITKSMEINFNEAKSVNEYYKRLNKEISAEITHRIEFGQFDRAAAEKLVDKNDRDIEYYNEYREHSFAERDFLDGKRPDKPELHISYDTRCEYDIAAVMEYLHNPAETVNARTDAYIEAEKAYIYKQIVRAEIQFESFREIEADKHNPLHYQRAVKNAAAGVKTVNITFERNGQSVTVKAEAGRLGRNTTVSDWEILAADRRKYTECFGYTHGGDAKMDEIALITHGKKELYNKAAFDKALLQGGAKE